MFPYDEIEIIHFGYIPTTLTLSSLEQGTVRPVCVITGDVTLDREEEAMPFGARAVEL